MPITTAFIKETVRLANIVKELISRETLVDIKMPNGDIMPRGTQWCVDIERMAQVLGFSSKFRFLKNFAKTCLGNFLTSDDQEF